MALPTVSSNSPSAGYIAWTAFGVAFDGDSFPIAAGNTNKKFVWWEYRAGVPAVVMGDVLPALAAEDVLLFLNKNGVGALVPMTDVVDGSLIVAGSLMAPAIAADQIETYHINAGAVTATEIQAGAIGATHISAGAITADKLSVGTVSDNMVVNGSFEDAVAGTLVGWEINAMTNGTITPVTGQSSSGAVSMQMLATTTAANLRFRQLPSQYIPVSAASSRKYYVACRAGASVATTNSFYIRVNWYTATKTLISSSDIRSNGALTTTFTLYEGQATPPATAKYMAMEILVVNPNVVTTAYIDEVVVHEVTMSAQIGDGQITTAKILAGNVTTDRLAAKAVTADKLMVSDFTNYAPDPSFESGGIGWNITGWTIATIADPIVTGTKALQAVANGTVKDAVADTIPVRDGDWYYGSCYVRKVGGTGGTVGTVQLGATVNRTTGGPTWPSFGTIPAASLTNAWVKIGGPVQMPALATSMQIRPSVRNDVLDGTYQFDDVQLRRMDGGELIVDGVIVASKIATNAVTSDKIIAGAVTADEIAANAVVADKIAADAVTANKILAGSITANKLESELVLASKIIAGDPTRTHTEMSPGGFRVFVRDPDETDPLIIPTEAIRLGVDSTDDYFAVTKADGSLAASISEGGVIGGTQLNATDSFYYKGTELTEILRRMPKGNVAYMSYGGINVGPISTPQGVGLFDLGFLAEAGRAYRISGYIRGYLTGGNGQVTTQLKVAYDGNTPSINSFDLTNDGHSASDGHWNTYYFNKFVHFNAAGGADAWARVLLVAGREVGPGNLTVWDSLMSVDDVGIQFSPTGTPNTGGGTTTPPKVNYVKQYGCNNSMNYAGGGGQYNYDTGRMYQGLSPAGYGNLKSIGLFPDMTADLSGASINYIRVYFNFAHWYYNGGGTARIGLHGHTGIPGTFSQAGTIITSGGWPKPGARWLDIDSSHWDNFKSGAYRGVSLEGDGTYGTYGYADRPTIEISYTK